MTALFRGTDRDVRVRLARDWSRMVTFVAAVLISGGTLILCAGRRVSADPFADGAPVTLWIASAGWTVLLGLITGRPVTVAWGLYFGTVAVMIGEGRAESPVASLIALGVHGLFPALVMALILVLSRKFRRTGSVCEEFLR